MNSYIPATKLIRGILVKVIVSALAALAFSAVAHATPAVGDIANYAGNWGTDAVTQTVSFTAFDQATNSFKQSTTTTIGTQAPASQEDVVKMEDTASDAALQDIVTNCANYGYVPETITVPAGTYPTCKIALEQGGFVYVGVVPFAVIKFDTTQDGKPLVLELQSFTRGS
jgi:hypothetical protein